MALGRRAKERQQEMWVASAELPKSQGHVFYRKLHELLAKAGLRPLCRRVLPRVLPRDDGPARPGIAPGIHFRMLLVGYLEGSGAQRGIAGRCADRLSLRAFLGVPLTEDTPDPSSLTRVRDRLPLEMHTEVFRFVLKVASEQGLLKGKTAAVAATTLEANAAVKSVVRRGTGEGWDEYLKQLMLEEGRIEEGDDPSDEELRRYDKQRKNKKVSNEEWVSKSDPESRITKRKDRRTPLAYQAEHGVDLETELVLAAEILGLPSAVEIDPQIPILPAPDRVPLSLGYVERRNPYCPTSRRKIPANVRRLI